MQLPIDYKGFPEWRWQKEGDTEYMLYTPLNTDPAGQITLPGSAAVEHNVQRNYFVMVEKQ